ncbi:MAG TPA: ACT domain-containing protein, partial [Alphaproteobacteria bacterium]|nr:ACT domain-containing protein [Alphaproteobacteria bacterium]
DRIVGLVTTGKGVTIHTIDCATLERYSDTPERWLDVGWNADMTAPDTHVGRIAVVVANEPGTLGELTSLIGKQKGNITNLRITNRSTEFFEITVDIAVDDLRHLSNIMAALRASPAINSVERARG